MERLALNTLIEWNQKHKRKPLMVYGARQVGKTYLVHELFAKKYYKNNYIYINLKFDDDMRNFVNGKGKYLTSTSNSTKIIEFLSLRENRVIDKDVLLIFDEIQEALPLISSLKDFKENHPEIPVIASGSLVRIKIKRMEKYKKEKFFYPVGSIDELYVYPMNFEEFLMNSNHLLYQKIVDAYHSQKPLDASIHNIAFGYLRDYLLVGGLPENVEIFLENKSHVLARKNLVTIYHDYLNDIDLYEITKETTIKTMKLFNNLFVEINRPQAEFRPSLFDEGKKTRDYIMPMQLLELAGVIYLNKRLKEYVTIPFKEDGQSNYRIYFFDPAFLAYQSGINMSDFINSNNTNMGVFFENYIASELSSYGADLFYWKGKNDSEFEFVVKEKGDIVPIDVKKRKGSLKSRENYLSHNAAKKFVKISENNYGYDENNKILTIPLYAFFMYAKELDNKML